MLGGRDSNPHSPFEGQLFYQLNYPPHPIKTYDWSVEKVPRLVLE